MATTDTQLAKSAITEAVAHLADSYRGRDLLRWLAAGIDNPDTDVRRLDHRNQEALFVLLNGLLGPFRGTAADMIRDASRSAGT